MGIGDPPEIEVLLATYNGARFLREQIDSILEQDYPHVRLLARDDGSQDASALILAEYARAHSGRFVVMPSSPASGSPKGNFLRLIQASTARYVSFADQDDVWLPDKLSSTKRAMDRLELQWGELTPLLVFTDLKVVDDELRPLHESFWARMGIDPGRIDRLSELLVQSVVTGCTALLNRPLLHLAQRMPEEALLHDRWIALLASTLGKSSIVRVPTVLYRQHGRNAVGLGVDLDKRTRSRSNWVIRPPRLTSHASQWEVSQRQARAFLRVHGPEVSANARAVLNAYLRCQSSASLFVRITTLLRYGFFYRGLLPNLLTLVYLSTTNANKRRLRDI